MTWYRKILFSYRVVQKICHVLEWITGERLTFIIREWAIYSPRYFSWIIFKYKISSLGFPWMNKLLLFENYMNSIRYFYLSFHNTCILNVHQSNRNRIFWFKPAVQGFENNKFRCRGLSKSPVQFRLDYI